MRRDKWTDIPSYHGIATHYVHSTSLPALESRLGELQFRDNSSMADRFAIINSTIEEFVTGLETPKPKIADSQRVAIDHIFDPTKDISVIQSELEKLADTPLGEWAGKTLATLRKRSPTSVLVTLKQMRDAKNWSIAEAFRREHAIASKFMAHPDFVEGVTEQLIKKGDAKKKRPDWTPPTFDQVKKSGVDEFFAGAPQLSLLRNEAKDDYRQYPHAWIGLPTEADIVTKVEEGEANVQKIVADLVQSRDGKQGVKEKAIEVLYRRFAINADGIIEGRL
jgi:3-hydroxyisobutyryl-CoA hydrolase